MKTILFCIPVLLLAFNSARAQTDRNLNENSITGTWKGSSLCQIKSSPCHDETVVYHISRSSGIDSFIVQANKIVNGVEEDMGPLVCRLERKTNQLICVDDKAVWTFNIKDGSMNGTLLVRGALYRIVRLKKQD